VVCVFALAAVLIPRASPQTQSGTITKTDDLAEPLAQLQSAYALMQAKNPAAVDALNGINKKLPKLADYTGWFAAQSLFDSGRFPEVAPALEPVFSQSPASPLIGRAAILAARAFLQSANAHAAVEILRKHYGSAARIRIGLRR
jgi:thioredoxin-like negative regulator of GroEL